MIPEFLIKKLEQQYGEKSKTIIDGYKKQRPTTIRINTSKTTKKEIIKELEQNRNEKESFDDRPHGNLCHGGCCTEGC